MAESMVNGAVQSETVAPIVLAGIHTDQRRNKDLMRDLELISGVRVIEAKCRLSLDEWLESSDDSRHKLLVPNQVLGPDLAFSPLVLIQLTDFKCRGKSVGMSWSHVLGDVFSAVGFINLWAQAMEGHYPAQPLTMAQQRNHTFDFQNPNQSPIADPMSTKRVGPVGDLWSPSNHSKMGTIFLSYFIIRVNSVAMFECVCVVIWHCLAKVRDGLGPNVVTVCRNGMKNRHKGIIANESQTIGLVKTDMPVGKYKPMELGSLLMNKVDDERLKIEEVMERHDALLDFLIYGANLTFVDLSSTSFYEMEWHLSIVFNPRAINEC
ncbi:hypothetical protein R6Q59_027972 [Mikania micrantha]